MRITFELGCTSPLYIYIPSLKVRKIFQTCKQILPWWNDGDLQGSCLLVSNVGDIPICKWESTIKSQHYSWYTSPQNIKSPRVYWMSEARITASHAEILGNSRPLLLVSKIDIRSNQKSESAIGQKQFYGFTIHLHINMTYGMYFRHCSPELIHADAGSQGAFRHAPV